MKAAAIFFRHRLVVNWRRRNGAADGVDYYFHKMTNTRQLTGIELIEQIVGVLFVHDLSSVISGILPSSGLIQTAGSG
ncbi:MAG TPA: hypothetical protein VG297_10450 [Bryobacteraceae bacterium]|nr:hypothetical protein [Bryobacteraceae bacterium]